MYSSANDCPIIPPELSHHYPARHKPQPHNQEREDGENNRYAYNLITSRGLRKAFADFLLQDCGTHFRKLSSASPNLNSKRGGTYRSARSSYKCPTHKSRVPSATYIRAETTRKCIPRYGTPRSKNRRNGTCLLFIHQSTQPPLHT